MRSKQIAESPKTFVIVLDTGDEILSSLKDVARGTVGWQQFQGNRRPEQCRTRLVQLADQEVSTAIKLQEQVELLSLIGDIALKDGEPQVHALIRL